MGLLQLCSSIQFIDVMPPKIRSVSGTYFSEQTFFGSSPREGKLGHGRLAKDKKGCEQFNGVAPRKMFMKCGQKAVACITHLDVPVHYTDVLLSDPKQPTLLYRR